LFAVLFPSTERRPTEDVSEFAEICNFAEIGELKKEHLTPHAAGAVHFRSKPRAE
jgi:hypothetical protein